MRRIEARLARANAAAAAQHHVCSNHAAATTQQAEAAARALALQKELDVMRTANAEKKEAIKAEKVKGAEARAKVVAANEALASGMRTIFNLPRLRVSNALVADCVLGSASHVLNCFRHACKGDTHPTEPQCCFACRGARARQRARAHSG